jgi:hypothetical protein
MLIPSSGRSLFPIGLLFLSAALITQSRAAAQTAIPTAAGLYRALSGHWVGTLEYRDYGNDKRVKLPTLLDVVPDQDPSSVKMSYTYDDGPGKIVKDTDIISVSFTDREYVVEEKDGSKTRYLMTEQAGFVGDAGGKLVLFGAGTENDKKVEVRTTVEVTPQTLRILRETRLPGVEFKFRHEYRFTRATAEQLNPAKP